MKPIWIDEISKDLMQIVHLACFKTGKNSKFAVSKFWIFHFLWIKTVATCVKHDSEVDKSLKWVDLDDPREK